MGKLNTSAGIEFVASPSTGRVATAADTVTDPRMKCVCAGMDVDEDDGLTGVSCSPTAQNLSMVAGALVATDSNKIDRWHYQTLTELAVPSPVGEKGSSGSAELAVPSPVGEKGSSSSGPAVSAGGTSADSSGQSASEPDCVAQESGVRQTAGRIDGAAQSSIAWRMGEGVGDPGLLAKGALENSCLLAKGASLQEHVPLHGYGDRKARAYQWMSQIQSFMKMSPKENCHCLNCHSGHGSYVIRVLAPPYGRSLGSVRWDDTYAGTMAN